MLDRIRPHGFVSLIGCLLMMNTPPLQAQAPQQERRAVEAILQLIDSSSIDAPRMFIQQSMTAQEPDDIPELISRLDKIRTVAKGRRNSVSVDANNDGLLLTLQIGTTEIPIELRLRNGKISEVLLQSTPDKPAMRRDDIARNHIRAPESARTVTLDALVKKFDQDHFSERFRSTTSVKQRQNLLAKVKQATTDAGNVSVNDFGDRLVIDFRGRRHFQVSFTLQTSPPFRIDTLDVNEVEQRSEGPATTALSDPEKLGDLFEQLVRDGFSGTVFLKLNGKVILKRAYGVANKELGNAVQLDTIFGIGSTPIDFTTAAVLMLAQEGKLGLDDPITKFFDGVPVDKRSITLMQLLSGRSGLPDFHHTSDDWDADLAWIDRDEAVARILAQPLRFEPGSDRAHSHSAFGLLAAVVERVSATDYPSFLQEHFFKPAGMTRTGMNAQSLHCSLQDFAVGWGPDKVGLPNIPPNWGPTSWLVMGSGGMCSTLEDMLRFYRLIRSDDILQPKYRRRFLGGSVNMDGSDRGFEKFHAYRGHENEAMVMTSSSLETGNLRHLFQVLGELVEKGAHDPSSAARN